MTGTVEVRSDDGVSTLTITNPPTRNALDDATRRALLDALRTVMADARERAVVLRGAGGNFCSGGDLPSMRTDDAEAIAARMAELHDIVRLVLRGPHPVVAAVEGAAFGSGLSLVAAADLVVAAVDARFCAPFTNVGVAPDVGILWSLPRRIGLGPARRMVLCGDVVSTPKALELGLVDEAVSPGGADSAARELALALARRAPLALAATKRMLLSASPDLDALLADEAVEQRALLGSADFSEGRTAFFERRPPAFEGR